MSEPKRDTYKNPYRAEEIGEGSTEEKYTVWGVNEYGGETSVYAESITIEEATARAKLLRKKRPAFVTKTVTTHTVVARYEREK